MPNKRKNKQKNKTKATLPNKAVTLTNNASMRPMRKPKSTTNVVTKKAHVVKTCQVTNPFCPAAKGAKWPDGTLGNTVTEQIRGFIPLGTTGQGVGMVCLSASAPFGIIGLAPSASTSTTITPESGYSTYKANSLLATYGGQYRIVSFGAIIRCMSSATTAAGMVTLGTTDKTVVGGVAYTLGSELYKEVVVKAIQPSMELSWISAATGPTAHEFVDQTGSAASYVNNWTNLVIEISAAANATGLLSVEWYMNIEFTLGAATSALTAIAPPNPTRNPVVLTSHSAVQKSIGSFLEGGITAAENKITSVATSVIDSFLADPLSSIAALFG